MGVSSSQVKEGRGKQSSGAELPAGAGPASSPRHLRGPRPLSPDPAVCGAHLGDAVPQWRGAARGAVLEWGGGSWGTFPLRPLWKSSPGELGP